MAIGSRIDLKMYVVICDEIYDKRSERNLIQQLIARFDKFIVFIDCNLLHMVKSRDGKCYSVPSEYGLNSEPLSNIRNMF